MRASWRWLAIGSILAGAAAGGIYYYARRQAKPTTPIAVATPVTTDAGLSLSGKVRARHIVPVAAPMDGTLEGIEVIEGQDIAEGQLLGQIRNSTLDLAAEQANLEVERVQTRLNSLEGQLIGARLEASRADADAIRARSALTVAERNFLRQRSLLAEGATPRLTFEKAEAEFRALQKEADALTEMARQAMSKVEVGQKSIEEAKKLLTQKNEELDDVKDQMVATEIHAPVDGVLVGQRAVVGAEVTRDMKDLFTIAVNLVELELTVEVTPAQAALLKPGQAAILQIAETGSEPIAAILSKIEGNQAIFEFGSSNPAVRPGLTGQIRVDTGSAAVRP